MSADPVTLLMLGAAASTATGQAFSIQGGKLERAGIKAEREQAKLAATEQALAQTQSFRQALSSQLALSALRGGSGGSLMRQFGAESLGNYLADMRAVESRKKYIDVASDLRLSQSKAGTFAQGVSSIGSLLQTGANTMNFSGGGQ